MSVSRAEREQARQAAEAMRLPLRTAFVDRRLVDVIDASDAIDSVVATNIRTARATYLVLAANLLPRLMDALDEAEQPAPCDCERAWCGTCGAEMQHVRPGKWQCTTCERIQHLEELIRCYVVADNQFVETANTTYRCECANCQTARRLLGER